MELRDIVIIRFVTANDLYDGFCCVTLGN